MRDRSQSLRHHPARHRYSGPRRCRRYRGRDVERERRPEQAAHAAGGGQRAIGHRHHIGGGKHAGDHDRWQPRDRTLVVRPGRHPGCARNRRERRQRQPE